jgi:hypothetical protein
MQIRVQRNLERVEFDNAALRVKLYVSKSNKSLLSQLLGQLCSKLMSTQLLAVLQPLMFKRLIFSIIRLILYMSHI